MLRALLVVLALLATTAPATAAEGNERDRYVEAGRTTLATIESQFRLPRSPHYAEKLSVGDAKRSTCFNWAAGVQLSALTAAAKVDPAYVADVRRYVKALDDYWYVDANGLGGYDASVRGRGDRYYDDNAWVVLALVEAFEVTSDRKLLDRAEATLRFVLSGEDDRLGGGIYWHEPTRKSKNTCSNAPTAAAAVRVWQHTKRPEHLDAARRLYAWTRKTLQDDDGLLFDNVDLEGKVERTKWSYNSALMIRTACLLHAATGDAAYLREAERIAAAAEKRWVKPDTGAIADGGRFAHLLADALLDLGEASGDPRWRRVVERAVEFVHANVDANGLYAERWDAVVTEPLRGAELIAQASAARAYWRLAWPAADRAGRRWRTPPNTHGALPRPVYSRDEGTGGAR